MHSLPGDREMGKDKLSLEKKKDQPTLVMQNYNNTDSFI